MVSCFEFRLSEHCHNEEVSPIFKHLQHYEEFNYTINLQNLLNIVKDTLTVNNYLHALKAIKDNTKVLEFSDYWYKLCFLEALYIRKERPELKQGIKVTEESVLFS